jgi:flavin reductase (DIM6/NTAB) family NADH-FMN oxidoreductase RutF
VHQVFDFSTMSAVDRYKLLCGVVVPRPIALVASIDAAGNFNAAPFSFYNVFSERSAADCAWSATSPEPKVTARNLARAGEFASTMVDEPLAATMNLAAVDFPPEVSEVETLAIATAPGLRVAVPTIAAAPFALACRKQCRSRSRAGVKC